jgi:protein-S-isoprenylcysteine O-methyltransferase Ste14
MTPVRPLRVAYACLGCFFIVERLLRRGAAARSFEELETDRGTTRALGRAFGLSLLVLAAAPLLNRGGIGRSDRARVAWTGVAIMSCGLALRVWAAQVLGASYTRTLRISDRQQIVDEGPYRLVRHPGYLGTLLLWLGAALASENWIAVPTIMVPMISVYHRRIEAEEAMLVASFGDSHARYADRTWRVIPFMY